MNKIESLSATVLAMKEALETLSGMKQENIFDMTQYVENINTELDEADEKKKKENYML